MTYKGWYAIKTKKPNQTRELILLNKKNYTYSVNQK